MKPGVFVIALMLAVTFPCLAEKQAQGGELNLVFGYYGETLTHPGISSGLEYIILDRGGHALFASFALGGFWHPKNVIALFTGIQPGYRFTLPFGLALELCAGVGYMHAFVDGPVYQATGGSVAEIANAGYPGFTLSAAAGVGWDFSLRNSAPLRLCLKLGGFGRYPEHGMLLYHAAVQFEASVPILGKRNRPL